MTNQMTEASKKRMETVSKYYVGHVRDLYEQAYQVGMSDPHANKELLEEMESFLEDLTSGSVSLKFSTSEGSKLLQKIREARK